MTGPHYGFPARACSNWAGSRAPTSRLTSRWAAGDAERLRRYAAELVALAPDVILANGSHAVAALLQVTRTFRSCSCRSPILSAPASSTSLAQPGGNATGFTNFEYSIGGKWLELLQEIAPRNASGGAAGCWYCRRNRAVGLRSSPSRPSWGWNCARSACATPVRSSAASPHSCVGVEWRLDRDDRARWRHPTSRPDHRAGGPAQVARSLPYRSFVTGGGLMSYGPDRGPILGARQATSTASSRARNRLTCRCRRRPNTS